MTEKKRINRVPLTAEQKIEAAKLWDKMTAQQIADHFGGGIKAATVNALAITYRKRYPESPFFKPKGRGIRVDILNELHKALGDTSKEVINEKTKSKSKKK